MVPSKKVLILSVFGRGNWLATELNNLGYSTTLVDLSESMGRWAPEDWEGPFGVLKSPLMKPSQAARLSEDETLTSVDNGWTFWMPEGPLELKGPFKKDKISDLEISSSSQDYILEFERVSLKDRRSLKGEVAELNFEEGWLPLIAHQLASNVYLENTEALDYGYPLSFFSAFYTRSASRRGLQMGLDLCNEQGVEVHRGRLQDVLIDGKKMSAIKIQDKELLKADEFIFCLSSEELQFQLNDMSSKILENVKKPEWLWMRFRFRFSSSYVQESLPPHFVLLSDAFLPWSHANMIVAYQTPKPEDYDIWIRIPIDQRFKKTYLHKMREDLLKKIHAKLPGVDIECVEMPQECTYGYEELGPPRFPVYGTAHQSKRPMIKAENVFFNGAETWKSLDWNGLFRSQEPILAELVRQAELEQKKYEERIEKDRMSNKEL